MRFRINELRFGFVLSRQRSRVRAPLSMSYKINELESNWDGIEDIFSQTHKLSSLVGSVVCAHSVNDTGRRADGVTLDFSVGSGNVEAGNRSSLPGCSFSSEAGAKSCLAPNKQANSSEVQICLTPISRSKMSSCSLGI